MIVAIPGYSEPFGVQKYFFSGEHVTLLPLSSVHVTSTSYSVPESKSPRKYDVDGYVMAVDGIFHKDLVAAS